MLGLRNRTAVWICICLSSLIGAGCLLGGFWDVRLFAGTALFLAAFWYLAAMSWVDRYGSW